MQNKIRSRAMGARAFLLTLLLIIPLRMWAVGWTPTDAGLAVNFEPGDRFLLSVMADKNGDGVNEEYFVCHYPSYTGGPFKYKAAHELRLIPQTTGATVPSEASIWTIDTAVTRISGKNNYALGGISYTMWSSEGYTLVTEKDSRFKFLGNLTNNTSNKDLCDVVFVVPTIRASVNMDPNGTLEASHTAEGRTRGDGTTYPTWAFDGKMGVGFAGMIYREVYMFDLPRSNDPNTYTNAALVTFNTTDSQKSWSNGQIKANPGTAAYAFADDKHKATQRMLFRLYVLDDKEFQSCSSYFFGWDTQDYTRYRQSNSMTDFTSWRKIYTLDHFVCMERESTPGSKIYRSADMKIPNSDSTYFYVGKNNEYLHSYLGSAENSASQFTYIKDLRVDALKGESTTFTPSKGAYGKMVVDTTVAENNLGVTFEPAGYFLRTNRNRNVRMRKSDDGTYWTCDEMWYITDEYIGFSIKATLMTGPEYSETDPGADIEGWSELVAGTEVPVLNHPDITSEGQSGWARIYPNNPAKNGGMVFVLARTDRHIHYDYNGLIGTAIPDQYPAEDATVTDGKITMKVQNARLKAGFTFLGWATSPGGNVVYKAGDDIEVPEGTTTLYAKGTFDDTYRVAFSFIHPTDGKRYFLTHPNTSAPRYARARTFTEWTDVYQGMSDADNSEPNFLSTYKMIGNPTCELCTSTEYVLDPRHETVKGVEDSLTFYEYWAPADDEFLGLYYTAPNTVIANNTWAGAFESTEGWPAYNRTAVDNTKISSTRYFTGIKTKDYEVHNRPRTDYLYYDPTTDQFDGVATAGAGTAFQITGIAVADAHYVILPDTTDATTPWTNEITFGYHKDESSMQQVWSKLIGKQLMACLRVGPDTVYFHPNRDKTLHNANDLRLSLDYRLTHAFQFIRDSRVAEGAIAAGDSAYMEETENGFCCNIYSGASSPIGPENDIVDTLRVWLNPAGASKIKAYYGRWKKGAEGLHINADGSRYRDILVTTKTYHYGPTRTRLVLKPELETYNFSPLADQSQDLTFTLEKQTFHQLLDATGAFVREDIIATKDTTTGLNLTGATCTLTGGSTYFTIGTKTATTIPLTTKSDNTLKANRDTLNISLTIDGKAVQARVPLMQAALTGTELVWSVVSGGKRYFIMAGSGGLIFREFTQNSLTLYKKNTSTPLIKGSKNAANDDDRYITPWTYSSGNPLQLKTESPVNKWFAIISETTPGIGDAGSNLTYEFVNAYTNDYGNYEEQVYLQYGPTPHWLKFTGSALELTTNKAEASLFSWSYLLDEYNLLNNGTYPNYPSVEFGYNSTASVDIKTAYKAYHEYSMLLDNKKVYVCRKDETSLANLVSTDPSSIWKTTYAVSLVPDGRTFDGELPKPTSGLSKTPAGSSTFTSTITPDGDSPTDVTIDGKYVNIVDTLQVTVGLQGSAPSYQFKGDWSAFTSVSDACLKIPMTRKTYHTAPYDSLVCLVDREEYNFAFPSTLREGESEDSLHTFYLETVRRRGTNTLDVDGNVASSVADETDTLTSAMELNNTAMTEIRLVDEYGNIPDWCEISSKGDHTLTMRCKSNGIRSPRSAHLYFAYIIMLDEDDDGTPETMRFVNFHMTVSQASLFQYANNQTLIHSPGASGDPLMSDGRQQTHENKRILYYYNPAPYDEADQEVELPIRERGFYGWWRWYREGGEGVGDTDVPDSMWIAPPRNVGKYNFPFRIIGDSVDDPENPSKKKLVTMGRYTVFHYPSAQYGSKNDPPAKSPKVHPPYRKEHATYVVDLGAYYDNLPLSMKYVNQIDTAVLDTMQNIIEPTLSLREVFELRPWTEMAEELEKHKYADAEDWKDQTYMEDHEVMAPIGNRLLLRTEQRYRYDNLSKKGHSESLLGYYMRDDNWSSMSATPDANGVSRQDTMIWCGGWDAECLWYTYNPETGEYTECTHPITVDDDFLNVPAKTSITAGKEADTIYYCLRSRSQATTVVAGKDVTVDGDNWFNICRYTVIYHDPRKYGPITEKTKGGETKALITNDEIEQNYEVLERLNFDYIKPGKDYHVYSHPLPWADGSYGYSYPVRPDIPDNRYHNDFAPNFPGVGEYGIINKIPYSNYWNKMEQHGGAENGYMIYCDGMNSAGQVAALSLETKLCEGQKMYFSGYVGNPSNQKGKANPNFTVTVQGSADGSNWRDITSYMTGDIVPSNQWYQIFFPINQQSSYDQFRVRIYNMASSFDGNDFIIDDLCIFATKPPLIAYQANTKCVEEGENDSITHIVLRVDYQGFVDTFTYNLQNVYYTVQQTSKTNDTTFVPMLDGYFNEETHAGKDAKPDTIFGHITMPAHTYVPVDKDSIFTNLSDFVHKFDSTFKKAVDESNPALKFNKGYLYENLDGIVRPVLYVIHQAKMTADNTYTVRLATGSEGLMNSKCAMTSNLKVTNRMVLMLDDEEKDDPNVTNMCANSTYELSVRVKGSLFLDSVAPLDVNGSCVNDWLLYGDTAAASSEARYGYSYNDIKTVVQDVLRCVPASGTNSNQFARTLAEVNKNEMEKYAKDVTLETSDDAYDVLTHLVTNGFLTLYQSKITATVAMGESLKYVIFPILGTGSEDVYANDMEICPTPMVIKLQPNKGGGVPLIVGGIHRDPTQLNLPVAVLVNERTANDQIALRIDSIMSTAALHSVTLLSTDDPDYYEGVHLLNLEPDKVYNFGGDNSGYYVKGNDILLHPSNSNNYRMRQGFNYTFGILMQTLTGSLNGTDGCPVGTVPFTLSIVPDYLRWDPVNPDNNQWNNPENWIGVTADNEVLYDTVRFAPLSTTDVIIPKVREGMPYPNLPNPVAIASKDSVKKVGFVYNTCDDIRFLPGAAIRQQQRLTYDVVVADMSLPHNQWTLCAAPVNGMISGDIYMSDADLSGETKMWSVGLFDADGRSYTTGNASYWLSVYSKTTVRKGNGSQVDDTTRTASADWSKVTNALTLPLAPAQGWAVYTRTASTDSAFIRLPKNDDRYYYYYKSGGKVEDMYEDNLRATRTTLAGGSGAGLLAYHPASNTDHQAYTIANDKDENGDDITTTSFIFGNPTMGYIDIWGFIADNSLEEEFRYIEDGSWQPTVTKSAVDAADPSTNVITNRQRYLPPMQAMEVKVASAVSSKVFELDTCRVVTHASQIVRPLPAPAPARKSAISNHQSPITKGIMTVTAMNAVSSRCTTRLLIGQGFHDAVIKGEDAVLTTVNIDNYSNTSYPATPFNIYAAENGYGLSVDLLDSVVNVPISFCMSDLPFDPVTQLWFTGVHAIDGQLVLYDALTGDERNITDGACLDIETPQNSHQIRYYIRRPGYMPEEGANPTDIGFEPFGKKDDGQAVKFIRNGHVFILRNGHIYTLFGQKVR